MQAKREGVGGLTNKARARARAEMQVLVPCTRIQKVSKSLAYHLSDL